jgi:hypothetical protein
MVWNYYTKSTISHNFSCMISLAQTRYEQTPLLLSQYATLQIKIGQGAAAALV